MYRYNDDNDALTIALIQSVSRDSYWEKSEKRILDMCKAELQGKRITNFLDLGCGLGRLIPVFLPYTKNLYAVEPDQKRYELAEKNWAAQESDKSGKQVIMVQGDIHTMLALNSSISFDAAISSHVLQHIPYDLAEDMFRTLSGVLCSQALLFVTTTAPCHSSDVYTKVYMDENGRRRVEWIDLPTFEQTFTQSGVLPVAFYTTESIRRLFNGAGFDLVKMIGYHYCYEDRFATLDDDIRQQTLHELSNARDVLYVFRKRIEGM